MQYWRECASDNDNKIFGCIWFWDIVGRNGPIFISGGWDGCLVEGEQDDLALCLVEVTRIKRMKHAYTSMVSTSSLNRPTDFLGTKVSQHLEEYFSWGTLSVLDVPRPNTE
jgi:hypothetical protein